MSLFRHTWVCNHSNDTPVSGYNAIVCTTHIRPHRNTIVLMQLLQQSCENNARVIYNINCQKIKLTSVANKIPFFAGWYPFKMPEAEL